MDAVQAEFYVGGLTGSTICVWFISVERWVSSSDAII